MAEFAEKSERRLDSEARACLRTDTWMSRHPSENTERAEAREDEKEEEEDDDIGVEDGDDEGKEEKEDEEANDDGDDDDEDEEELFSSPSSCSCCNLMIKRASMAYTTKREERTKKLKKGLSYSQPICSSGQGLTISPARCHSKIYTLSNLFDDFVRTS